MLEKERQFHVHECRVINDCWVWAWIMGNEDFATFFYLLDPLEGVCTMWEEAFGLKPLTYARVMGWQ